MQSQPLPKQAPGSEFKILEDIDRLRGQGDRSAFQLLFLQMLLIRCVAARASSPDGLALNLSSKGRTNLCYSDIAEDLAWINDALMLGGGTRFEALRRPPFGDELVRELAARIDAMEIADHAGTLPIIFDHALRSFACDEDRHGVESTTPDLLANLLVALAAPSSGTVLDPCSGCGGLLVRAHHYARTKTHEALDLYGQETNASTRKLAQMNLVANGIQADLGERAADSLVYDCFPQLEVDFVLADPPVNLKRSSDTAVKSAKDVIFDVSCSGSDNLDWPLHFIKHLSPKGLAVFTSSRGQVAGTLDGDVKIREQIVRADLVDCIIRLPKGLFDSSRNPGFIWVLATDKSEESIDGQILRSRRNETLFIDAQNSTTITERRGRPLKPTDITRFSDTYHSWKSLTPAKAYTDVPGYCRSVRQDEIVQRDFDLSPSRYMQSPQAEIGSTLSERIRQFKLQLTEQLNTSARLDAEIYAWLRKIPDEI